MRLLDLDQNTVEWEKFRLEKIGSSDAPIILGVSPWKTPFQLWLEKRGDTHKAASKPHMQRGHDLEEKARHAFEKAIGIVVFPRVVQSSTYDWMIASLDGIDIDQSILVEIKCPGKVDQALANKGKIPEKYYPQLQHQLAASGLDLGFYYSFDGEQGIILEVKRDDAYIDQMLEKETAFFQSIQSDTPPSLTDRDHMQREDSIWREKAEKWRYVQEKLKRFETEEKRLREELIELADSKSCEGGGIRMTLSMRKGAIDYRSIPLLQGMDLESYRKKSSIIWSIKAL